MDIAQESEYAKRRLTELIIQHLRENKISPEKAKQLASEFLTKLPFQDQKDLLAKLEELGNKYDEAKELHVEELSKNEEHNSQNTLQQMRDHIEKGNIDEAVNAARALSSGK